MNVRKISNFIIRALDYYFISYFVFNLFLVVLLFDVTVLFCQENIPCIIPSDIVTEIYQHAKLNDQVMWNKPVWYLTTIWWGLLVWGPFYILAVCAFIKKKDFIRIPCLMYSACMLVIISQGISEQLWGQYKTSYPEEMIKPNIPYVITPILLILRMLSPYPFTQRIENEKKTV